ncbi:MAG: ABC transporter ATP-binding protein [Terrimicrobiaceae bacterium]|jgi:subfamily B ATP-binding cassette protein MsbA
MSKPKRLPFPQLVREFWHPYLRLARYLAPYKKHFGFGVAFGAAAGAISGLLPVVMSVVGQRVLPGGKMPGIRELGNLPTDPGPGIETVVWMSLLIPAVMILRGVMAYLNTYYLSWVSLRVLSDLRSELFSHLMSQSLEFFNRSKSGLLSSRVLNDTRQAQSALTSISSDIIKDPIAVIVGVGALVYIDWKFSLTTLVLFPICIIPVVFFGRKVREASRAEENESAEMSVILQESFAGVRVVKSFAREDYQSGNFRRVSEVQVNSSMRVKRSQEIVQPLIESVSAIGIVLAIIYVYFYGINLVRFIALCGGIFLLYKPVKTLSRIPMLMQKCMVSAENIFNLMEEKSPIADAPDAVVLKRCDGRIEFDRVSFSYGSNKSAVADIHLDIQAGKKYALVGASGAGKSTLLSLILRFYDPQSGAIRLDGHDLRAIKQASLREQIGVVNQDTFLFHDSIYENIRYGRLDATEAEIFDAARSAYAHDFILAQPKGYQTIVGDKGCLLSGGQQQRLAIARALLKNAPILLLDEATSALDSESEKLIQVALEKLSEGRTVIAIAHRLSTVLKSDCIVVMDHGRVVETGTHRELLEKSDIYRHIYEIQFHHDQA